MKLFPVLAVLAATLLIVHADFYVNLFYRPTEEYLGAVPEGGEVYLKASRVFPSPFIRLRFVTSVVPKFRAAIENRQGTHYFCRDPSNNDIKEIYPVSEPPPNCIYHYRVLLDSDNPHNYSISMRADNDKFWDLGGSDGKFIRATGERPVYFEVREAPFPTPANVGFTDLDSD